MFIFRYVYEGAPELSQSQKTLNKLESNLIALYRENKLNDENAKVKFLSEVRAYYETIKNDKSEKNGQAFCYQVFEKLGAGKEWIRAPEGAQAELQHYANYFSVLANSSIEGRFFFSDGGVRTMTRIMDDIYKNSFENREDEFVVGSFKKYLNVTYNNREDAELFAALCSKLPGMKSVSDVVEEQGKFVAKTSLELAGGRKTKVYLPKDYQFNEPEKKIETEVVRTRQKDRTKVTVVSQSGRMLGDDVENEDIHFVGENRLSGVEKESNQRTVDVPFMVDRYLAEHYVHGQTNIEKMKEALNTALLQIAAQMGFTGSQAVQDFLSNWENLEKFVASVKDSKMKIWSTATVEKVYGSNIGWNEVKAELERNLKSVALKYGEELNSYFNSILFEAYKKNGKEDLFKAVQLPIVPDLALLQEIPPKIREKWLADPKSSPELKDFLSNRYSDARVKENRYNIFATIYHDAEIEKSEYKTKIKDKNSATYAYERLKKALDFKVDANGIVTDVSIKDAADLNICISLARRTLRWVTDKQTGQSSYFDQMLQMGDFGKFRAGLYGIQPSQGTTYNRALGFAVGEGETLGVEILPSKEKMELGKEYVFRVKASQNGKVPEGGKMVIKVDIGGEQTELVATSEGNGIYSAVFTPTKPGDYSFLAYYVHHDEKFFSGRVVSTMNVEKVPEKVPKTKVLLAPPTMEMDRDIQFNPVLTGNIGSYFGGLEADEFTIGGYGGYDKLRLLSEGSNAFERTANINSLFSWIYDTGPNGGSAYKQAWINAFGSEEKMKKFFSLAASGQAEDALKLVDQNSPLANCQFRFTNSMTSFKDINEMFKAFEHQKGTIKLGLDLDLFKSDYAQTKVYLVYNKVDARFYLTGGQGAQSLSMHAGNVTVLQAFNLKGDKQVEVDEGVNSLLPEQLDKFHASLFGTAGLSFASIRSGSVFNFMPSDRTYWGFNTSIGAMLKWDLSDESAIKLLTEVGWDRFLDNKASQRSDTFSLNLNLKYQLSQNMDVGFNSRLSQIQVLSSDQPDLALGVTPLSVKRDILLKPNVGFRNMFGVPTLGANIGPTVRFTQGAKPSLGFSGELFISPSALFGSTKLKGGYDYERR